LEYGTGYIKALGRGYGSIRFEYLCIYGESIAWAVHRWDHGMGFCFGREKVFGLSQRLYEACHLQKKNEISSKTIFSLEPDIPFSQDKRKQERVLSCFLILKTGTNIPP
jgi:hypothetical protein